MGVCIGLSVNCMWKADLISRRTWRYTIGDTFNFGSFWVTKLIPFWDPNFTPRCGQLVVLYLFDFEEPGPDLESCT